jgi:hypothetical protein
MLSNSADAGTSLRAFHYGAYERNPLVISTKPAPFLIQTAVFSTVEGVVCWKLEKTHPKLVKALMITGIGLETSLAVRNYKVGTELKNNR